MNEARLELLVSQDTKDFLIAHCKRLNIPVKVFAGTVLSEKVNTFAEAANSDAIIQAKLDAISGQLAAIDRSIASLEALIDNQADPI
jgi:hypothetical protein